MTAMDAFITEMVRAIPNLFVAIITLGLGWFVGQRLTVYWSIQQRHRELAISTAHEFHSLYGEFFAVWKLWNTYIRDAGVADTTSPLRWELLKRAANAEGAIEAILVRLALEHDLS